MCCHFVFYLNHKNVHSARYLFIKLLKPEVERRANTQPRERVGVLQAAGVAAAVAERNAGHKRGQHGQQAEEHDARRRHDELAGSSPKDEGKSESEANVHCSETQGCLRKYGMIINSHAWSLIMY